MNRQRAGSYRSHAVRRGRTPKGRGVAALTALIVGIIIGGLLFSSGKEAERLCSPSEDTHGLLPLTPAFSGSGADVSPAPSDAGGSPAVSGGKTVTLPSPVITVSVKGKPVNMELEEYLIGVVAGEMPASSEPAALCAQAVAARTFTALHMAGKAKCRSGCTVCDDPGCCQAYLSPDELASAWGEKYSEYIKKITTAVRETEGLVSVYDGELISAFYHASSGPATESSEEVFAMALPYLVSVDSREGDREMVTRQEFSAEEVVRRINLAYPEANMTLPLSEGDLDIWGRTESGRVQLIRIGETVIPGGALRKVLGLKSTAFDVKKDGDTVTFTCLGYGHGVGMSQTGANEMAKEGAGFDEILKHYYTGTEIVPLEFGE